MITMSKRTGSERKDTKSAPTKARIASAQLHDQIEIWVNEGGAGDEDNPKKDALTPRIGG
jgi:hypothetical protein